MENSEIKELLLDLKKGQKELFEGQEETNASIRALQKGQEELYKGQDKLFKEMDKLSLSVARIEADHGEKLGILLDVVTSHINKFDSENERIEKCEKRLDNHDDKIYVLNSVVHAY